MLNAFRHHRVLRNRHSAGPLQKGISAQRLSASQGATQWTRPVQRRLSLVLNAFRHHRVLRASRSPESQPPENPVLNAFRHHRVLRRRMNTMSSTFFSRCSTPFGITGCYAGHLKSAWKELVGAQRLSASQGATPSTRSAGPWWWSSAQRLSASQGATHAQDRVALHQGKGVLNAFRHHRVLRANTSRWIAKPNCAQRLSASQGATRWLPSLISLICSVCSTPFGITGCYARNNVSDPVVSGVCSTPFGITGCYAHRKGVTVVIFYLCSTPFGITGCYAFRRTASPCSCPRVLNAFRHHRVLRCV